MYMHKKGVEYYSAFIGHVKEILNQAVENTSKGREINSFFINGELQNVNGRKTLEVLQELENHSKNIKAHIANEKTVIKSFIDTIHSNMGTSLTDPKTQNLIIVASSLTNLDRNYQKLEENVSNVIKLFTNLPQKAESININQLREEVASIRALFFHIHDELKGIYNMSKDISLKLYQLLKEIKKESELIKKEEQLAEDFQRNLMSWF